MQLSSWRDSPCDLTMGRPYLRVIYDYQQAFPGQAPSCITIAFDWWAKSESVAPVMNKLRNQRVYLQHGRTTMSEY